MYNVFRRHRLPKTATYVVASCHQAGGSIEGLGNGALLAFVAIDVMPLWGFSHFAWVPNDVQIGAVEGERPRLRGASQLHDQQRLIISFFFGFGNRHPSRSLRIGKVITASDVEAVRLGNP